MIRKLWSKAGLSLTAVLFLAGPARAEISLVKADGGWEFYTTGRIGAFAQLLQGGARPNTYDASGMLIHPLGDGGILVVGDPLVRPDGTSYPGPVLTSRVGSGFVGNIVAFGVRRQLTERTTVMGHISIWATSETDNRRTWYKNVPDEREAYLKIEGPAGSLLVGRALSLYSRGATEIDFLYGHGFGVGNPGAFDLSGPTAGHIGYGVLGSVFAAGIVYATPKLGGLQLTAGYFDPATFVGKYWTRAKLGRPEAELTYDVALGTLGKIHAFVNGAYQKMYATDLPVSTDVYGGGAGARVEVGPVHLGVAGHYGQGLGVHYFMDGSDAVLNQTSAAHDQLRIFDGFYVQSQFILGKFDLNAGWGITRVHKLAIDYDPMYFDPNTNQPLVSFLKSQMGVSGVVVYHVSDSLHFAVDYFRSQVNWWLGEQQVINCFNIGSTLLW